MKKTILLLSLLVATCGIISQSCKKTEDTPKVEEFVADNNSFKDYSSWPLQRTYNGPDPLLGATAHANNDSTVVRKVYFKNGQERVNGKFPVGTIVVKHSTNPAGTVNEVTAMVKRGNNFDASNNDWEYFMLKPDGTLLMDPNGMVMRGAKLMGGMCAGCHGVVSAKDYIYSK
ncbi:MAG: cytochrome P460 family protein [Bacteroidota bacterium]|nr:cytochrome P460 family protein [Bacteroidota bacterium]